MEPKIFIELDNLSKEYIPGQRLCGRLIIISTEQKDTVFKAISIRIEGKRVARIRRNQVEEFYFLENQRKLTEVDQILSPEDTFVLHFNFLLPHGLPSSFRLGKGCIIYSIVYSLQRNFEFDMTGSMNFSVHGVLALNLGNTSSIEQNVSKTSGCFSCFRWRQGRRFGMMVKLFKDQFIPGESIHYFIRIWNATRDTLVDVQIELIREFSLLDSGNYNIVLKESETIATLLGPVVKPGEKLKWTSTIPPDQTESDLRLIRKPCLVIPEDNAPPSNLGCRSVVQLNYLVQVSASTSSLCSSILICRCPIVIGTSFNT